MMKKIFCLTLFLLIFPILTHIATADDHVEAEKLLKIAVDKVMTALSSKELTIEQKQDSVVETVNSVFGFKLMAKLSLGKTHWGQLNPEQKIEFTNLFVELLTSSYTDKLELFQDEKVVFKPLVVKKNKVHVPTGLISKGKEFSVLYKMSKTSNEWKVYDVEIEGVSLIHTYRSQYSSVLKNGGIEDLLKLMREKKAGNTAS